MGGRVDVIMAFKRQPPEHFFLNLTGFFVSPMPTTNEWPHKTKMGHNFETQPHFAELSS